MAKCEHDVNNFQHLCLLTGGACDYVGRIKECKLRKKPGEAETEGRQNRKARA